MASIDFANYVHVKWSSAIADDHQLADAMLTNDVLGDKQCIRLDINGRDFSRQVWFAVDFDGVPVRIRDQFGLNVRLSNVDLVSVKDLGWFPRRISYQVLQDDITKQSQELEVSVISVNEPLSDGLFTFPGMGAPDGTVVYDMRKGGEGKMMVSNGELISINTRNGRVDEVPPLHEGSGLASRSFGFWILIVNGVMFVCIALFIVWYRQALK